MGCLDFALRCVRIICVRLYACVSDAYENVKTRVLHGGRQYHLLPRTSEEPEDTGLLSDDDEELGEAVRKDDSELYEQAKAIVEKKAKKKLEALRSPPKAIDDEDAWLDSLKADDGV